MATSSSSSSPSPFLSFVEERKSKLVGCKIGAADYFGVIQDVKAQVNCKQTPIKVIIEHKLEDGKSKTSAHYEFSRLISEKTNKDKSKKAPERNAYQHLKVFSRDESACMSLLQYLPAKMRNPKLSACDLSGFYEQEANVEPPKKRRKTESKSIDSSGGTESLSKADQADLKHKVSAQKQASEFFGFSVVSSFFSRSFLCCRPFLQAQQAHQQAPRQVIPLQASRRALPRFFLLSSLASFFSVHMFLVCERMFSFVLFVWKTSN